MEEAYAEMTKTKRKSAKEAFELFNTISVKEKISISLVTSIIFYNILMERKPINIPGVQKDIK